MYFLVNMPDLIVDKILSYLDTQSLVMLSRTNRKFNRICDGDRFWKEIRQPLKKSFLLNY